MTLCNLLESYCVLCQYWRYVQGKVSQDSGYKKPERTKFSTTTRSIELCLTQSIQVESQLIEIHADLVMICFPSSTWSRVFRLQDKYKSNPKSMFFKTLWEVLLYTNLGVFHLSWSINRRSTSVLKIWWQIYSIDVNFLQALRINPRVFYLGDWESCACW